MIDRLHRIWSLFIKELLQLSRDKLLLGFIIIGPLLELALMGGLVGGGVQNLPAAVIDLDRSRASRELITRLDQAEELMIRLYSDSVSDAQAEMHRGDISVIVVIPPGYGDRLFSPRQTAEVQVIADDSNYVVAVVATSTSESVANNIVRDLASYYGEASRGPIELRFVARFNAALDDRPKAITAMLGLIVYQVTLVIAAQSFTRERELGTLEQLRITPLRQVELIVGKAIPTLLIGLVDGLLMVGVIVLWFDVPVRGSLLLLLLLTIPFVIAQIGWGTLISLVSRTQQQSVLFVFAIAMLEVACSGFIVPASDMPGVMRVVSNASAVQHYLVVLRGVLIRGAGLSALWRPTLSLLGIGLGATAIAWLRLRAGLDTDSLQQRLRALWRARQQRREERKAQSLHESVEKRSGKKPGLTGKPA